MNIKKYENQYKRIFGDLYIATRPEAVYIFINDEGYRQEISKEFYDYLKNSENRYIASQIYKDYGYEDFLDYCYKMNIQC